MQHLRYLKIVNYVYGGLLLLVALVMLAVLIGLVSGEWAGVSRTHIQIANTALVIATIVTSLVALLVLWTGTQVQRARGRVLQSILAVVSVFEFPFGTVYGLYALYVCWVNEPTREAFGTDTMQPV